MKKILLAAVLCLSFSLVGYTQTQSKKGIKKTPAATKTSTFKQAAKKDQLKNTASYKAKSKAPFSMPIPRDKRKETEAMPVLQVSDPVILALSERKKGNYTNKSLKDITGAGKGAYGIVGGQIVLVPAGARTSGSFTGSGAVGTGTSPGVVGAEGHYMGLNGKNPYSGSGLFGNSGVGTRLGINPPVTGFVPKKVQ